MSQQLATPKSSSIRSICLGVLVLLLLINQLGFSQARYLPTRADESRKEMLKAMLKELMDMPQTYETDSRYASGKSRYGPAYPAEPSYLAKRSVPSSEHLINRLAATEN